MRDSIAQANRPFTAGSPTPLFTGGLIAVVLVMVSALNIQAQTTSGTPQQVIIKQMHFEPSTLSVNVGDRVDWKNEDIFTHTVTADDGSFNSGLIPPGASWQTTMVKTGTIAYHCSPHPNMKAALAVQQPGAQAEEKTTGQVGESDQGSLRWRFPTKPEELHPILVNFTAALLPLALLSDLLGLMLRRQGLHSTAAWMMVYEAALTPLTVIAGWWWRTALANQLPAKLILVHQWLGTAAALLFFALAAWRWSFHKRSTAPTWAYLACTALVLLALVYQGSIGGAMAFGQ